MGLGNLYEEYRQKKLNKRQKNNKKRKKSVK
jgi:hypothetical protein